MNAHVQRWIKTQGQPMSLLQKTDVYQGLEEKTAREHPEYGFALALICGAVCHDKGGADVLDRPGRREAAGCWKISQTKISQSPPEQERKTQKRLGLTLPFQSPRLDIMPHNGGKVGHSPLQPYNVCK